MSFCQINYGQMKQNIKNLKQGFFNNISSFNPMVLLSINEKRTNWVHFYKPSFEYLHFLHNNLGF